MKTIGGGIGPRTRAVLAAGAAACLTLFGTPAEALWEVVPLSSAHPRHAKIGDGRGDGVERVYALGSNSYQTYRRISEYSRANGGWKESVVIEDNRGIAGFQLGIGCDNEPAVVARTKTGKILIARFAVGAWSVREASPSELSGFVLNGLFGSLSISVFRELEMSDGKSLVVLTPPALTLPGSRCLSKSDPVPALTQYSVHFRMDPVEGGTAHFFGYKTRTETHTSYLLEEGGYGSELIVPDGEAGERYHFVIEQDHRGKWKLTKLNIGPFLTLARSISIPASDSNPPRMFTAPGAFLGETSWDEGRLRFDEIGEIGNLWSVGIAYGNFRRDGINRLYAADSEWTETDSRWRREKLQTRNGLAFVVGGLKPASGKRAALIASIGRGPGLGELKWTAGPAIVVAPFIASGVSHADADGFSELIRQRITGIGNCRVLERERVDAIIAEHHLQNEDWTAPKSAVRLGELLGAGQVVVGSLGKLAGSYVASVNAVSVHDGVIDRVRVGHWNEAQAPEPVIDRLAAGICPAGNAALEAP
ncbi:MAG: hypothetical protein AUJ52_05020 [Elusimicrobia bacterium CG1_02_63_36]|nr:MAG: hypothetical protein AUJ52_05020 [Elusimicrobia bacterium CG1_02_63_36]PIP81787.1 MAG: hypothetical protein COR54_18365 [Elusimicrobia bacterium CG22_combo_CG10-13_8_21_14_all_63_91]PJA16388.1 MAG: hypothetical protein COX66_07670 [Elusimicrobia bacterium CG_4_10_14_0_2_um_filter_63_34]PJB27112.1 MAG: hypothetical protein CO113_00135 [Elusimicrobia bacterium CG_4_9_14_3_um_filter_62_55]